MMLDWPRTPPPTAAVQDALQRVSATVAIATGLASTGRAIDLAGIDAAAGRLCAQVLDLPPALGAAFRPALLDLDTSLVTLAALLRTRAS